MSKDVGKAPSLDDLGAAMHERYTEPTDPQPTRSSASRETATPSQPATTRRSWLLPTDVAGGRDIVNTSCSGPYKTPEPQTLTR